MNPTQKSGNYKPNKRRMKSRKGDYRVKKIARMEAKKAITKTVETKVLDNRSTAFNIDYNASTSVFSMLNGMGRGTGETQYIGNSITPTHLRIRWTCQCVDFTNVLRVVVIQNLAGGVAIGGTVFQTVGSVVAPLSPYNTTYNETYRVLYDEFFTQVYGTNGTDTYLISGDIRIPFKKLRKITFDTTLGTTVTKGDIYLIFISDSSNVTPPIGQYYARLYFKDA